MLSRVVAFVFAVIYLIILIATLIYVPELYVLVFASILYACIKCLRNEEYREAFIVKSERKLYYSIILSITIIISLLVYFVIVDSWKLYFTLFLVFCMFSAKIKDFAIFVIHDQGSD